MEKPIPAIGSYAPDFELPGVDGEVHHLARYLEKYQAVCAIFMSNSCPIVDLYLSRIEQIQRDFEDQGFLWIGINANDATEQPKDSFENMKAFAKEHQLNFPYLRDPTQDVAHCFGASIVPECFLLDHQGILRYRGSIDDNPQAAEAVKLSYLRNAIGQVLNREVVTPNYIPPSGCSLTWRA